MLTKVNGRRITVDNPLPGHTARIARVQTGVAWNGGRRYGGKLTCECGYESSTNEALSKGGNSELRSDYIDHVAAMQTSEGRAELAGRLQRAAAYLTQELRRGGPIDPTRQKLSARQYAEARAIMNGDDGVEVVG